MMQEMPTAVAMWTNPVNSRALSAEARYVASQYDNYWRPLHRSYSIGIGSTGLLEQLYDVRENCAYPGWDGYDAVPVSQEAYLNAFRFIESIPLEFPVPTVSAEPDGHVTFEWHVSPRRTLSVSVSPEGEIHYAALMGSTKTYGTEPFSGEIPPNILILAIRVAAV